MPQKRAADAPRPTFIGLLLQLQGHGTISYLHNIKHP